MSWGSPWGGPWGDTGGGLAKEDTRLLLLADLAEDLSQYATDLTAVTGGAYETSSARTALTGAGGREIYVRFFYNAGDEYLYYAGHHAADLSDHTWLVGFNEDAYLVLSQNGVEIWSEENYSSPAFSDGADLSLSWSTRPNPDTTGAGNALISEILVYRHDTEQVAMVVQVTHAVATTSTSWTLSVGGLWDGSKLGGQPFSGPPTKIRVSRAWHPHTEAFEDWIVQRPAYAGTREVPTEPLPLTVASGVGDSGEFVGRAQVGFAAAHAGALAKRFWSPLVNESWRSAPTISISGGYLARHRRIAPGSAAYQMAIPHLRWVPVPVGATHAIVRVHVQSWVTSGAAVPIGIRTYALNRPPQVNGALAQQLPVLDSTYCTGLLTVDHTSTGVGEWLELGVVRLPIVAASIAGWQDTVHLVLAWAIDPAGASSNDAAARLRINAWSVTPVEIWTPGGYFGG